MKAALEQIVVKTSAGGQPSELERGGRRWVIAEEPLRWFERIKWWERQNRMPKGFGLVDVEVWRVQARLGLNPQSELATMDLERDQISGGWSLRLAA